LNTGFKNDPLFRQFSPIENAHICHRVANVLVPSMNIFGIFAALTWKCFSSCQLENFGNGVSIATFAKPKNCRASTPIHPPYQQLMVIIIIILVFVCFSPSDAEAANIFGPKAFHGL